MYAAPRADERFKRVFGEQPFDAPEQRLLIFAVLRAEIYEVSVNAAAFQQTELPHQRLRLLRAPLAAYQRQIAGYAVAPQLAARCGLVQRIFYQCREHRHGRPGLIAAHASERRRGGAHAAAVKLACGQQSQRAVKRFRARSGEAERETDGLRGVRRERKFYFRADLRRGKPAGESGAAHAQLCVLA